MAGAGIAAGGGRRLHVLGADRNLLRLLSGQQGLDARSDRSAALRVTLFPSATFFETVDFLRKFARARRTREAQNGQFANRPYGRPARKARAKNHILYGRFVNRP